MRKEINSVRDENIAFIYNYDNTNYNYDQQQQ